jgi:hypothetical protein
MIPNSVTVYVEHGSQIDISKVRVDKDYVPKKEESKALCVEDHDRQWVAIPLTRDHKPDEPDEH